MRECASGSLIWSWELLHDEKQRSHLYFITFNLLFNMGLAKCNCYFPLSVFKKKVKNITRVKILSYVQWIPLQKWILLWKCKLAFKLEFWIWCDHLKAFKEEFWKGTPMAVCRFNIKLFFSIQKPWFPPCMGFYECTDWRGGLRMTTIEHLDFRASESLID